MSFIIPVGDSLPATSIHPPVSPPNNVETGLDGNSSTGTNSASGIIPMPVSSVAPSASPAASDTIPASFSDETTPAPLQPAAIAGIVLLVLTIIGLILCFVRWYFVSRRDSKVTPARSRASKVVISGPTDFQHVGTAGRSVNLWNINDGRPMNVGTAQGERWNPRSQPGPPREADVTKDEEPWATTETPYNKNKQKYSVNFSALESGLHDHVQTMQVARNPRHDGF